MDSGATSTEDTVLDIEQIVEMADEDEDEVATELIEEPEDK